MDLTFPHAEDIDSLCHALEQGGPETPPAIAPRCRSEAVAWFVKPDGTRLYVCRDHALEPFRFPSADLRREDLPDDYNELRSLASEKGISLQSPTRERLENRLLSPPDPTTFDEAPKVVRCATCNRITLHSDVTTIEGRCPSCESGVPTLDPEDYAVTSPPEE